MIGPCLPSHLSKSKNSDSDDTHSDSPEPKHNEQETSCVSIGPALPPHLLKEQKEDHGNNSEENDDEETTLHSIGPGLSPSSRPVEDDEDEDNDVIGPSIPTTDKEQMEKEYLIRLAFLKSKQEVEKNTPKREEWMTTLPAKMANYGLGARQFSKSSGNTSTEMSKEWTETPEQKRRRMAGDIAEPTSHSELNQKAIVERDRREEKRAQAMNKNRGGALLDEHRKNDSYKQKEDESDVINGRRAFNIERDMSIRGRRENVSAEEIKEHCGELNSRFGHGKSQKFL